MRYDRARVVRSSPCFFAPQIDVVPAGENVIHLGTFIEPASNYGTCPHCDGNHSELRVDTVLCKKGIGFIILFGVLGQA